MPGWYAHRCSRQQAQANEQTGSEQAVNQKGRSFRDLFKPDVMPTLSMAGAMQSVYHQMQF